MDGQETLRVQVEDLAATVTRLSSELADLSAAVSPLDATSTLETPEYQTVDEWVHEYFCPMFARPIGGEIRWCERWTDHAEAVSRLEALWRSWEVLRRDPGTGMATWFSSFLDAQLPILVGRAGTFAQCTAERHECPRPLGQKTDHHAATGSGYRGVDASS